MLLPGALAVVFAALIGWQWSDARRLRGDRAALRAALAGDSARLAEAKGIAPLTNVTVTARVRNGRSQPTGAPVLDIISIIKR